MSKMSELGGQSEFSYHILLAIVWTFIRQKPVSGQLCVCHCQYPHSVSISVTIRPEPGENQLRHQVIEYVCVGGGDLYHLWWSAHHSKCHLVFDWSWAQYQLVCYNRLRLEYWSDILASHWIINTEQWKFSSVIEGYELLVSSPPSARSRRFAPAK